MPTPEIEGVLSAADVVATAETIAEWQLPTGMIPWYPGGHADPWNHIEAAMALDIAGLRDPAERAYGWLRDIQRPDGSWHQYYLEDEVEDPKLDANVIAYIAAGVWHHYLVTGERNFTEEYWPIVESAIDFVLDLQQPRGEILWARHTDGTPWSFALLTGSSSICHSLRCAIALADDLGHERPDWELSLRSLAAIIRNRPEGAFAPKHRWAMDWYYPVLCGAISGEEGRTHLAERRNAFVMEDKGVRCVGDRPWVTAAETCECALAHLTVGETEIASQLFEWIQTLRVDSGHYWTGRVYPQMVHFPTDEQSTYSAAAVLLAADALGGDGPASKLFSEHETLPAIMGVSQSVPER